MNGKTICLSWLDKSRLNPKDNPELNVFIKNLEKNISHKELVKRFLPFGIIISLKIEEDEFGESMGYGYVLYNTIGAVDSAIQGLNGSEWNGKKIYVGKYIKKKPRSNKFNNVYVKNIPKEFPDELLINMFSKYGEISSSLIKYPEKANLKKNIPEELENHILNHKFAFICYKEASNADKVVNIVPFLKIYNNSFNSDIEHIAKILRNHDVPEK